MHASYKDAGGLRRRVFGLLVAAAVATTAACVIHPPLSTKNWLLYVDPCQVLCPLLLSTRWNLFHLPRNRCTFAELTCLVRILRRGSVQTLGSVAVCC